LLNNFRFLAVIPARGGSKSVPRKNIRPLNGRPLLAWTVDQVKNVPEIDLVIVSTDDEEITTVAKHENIDVIQRPSELATDTASTESALLHALDVLESEGHATFDYIIVLEPTSPLRKPETIQRCMRAIFEKNGKSLMTVIETKNNIGRRENGQFYPLNSGAPRRRQERKSFFIESSTVYIASVDYLKSTGSLVCENWLCEIVDDIEAIDINNEMDFIIAEQFMKLDNTKSSI